MSRIQILIILKRSFLIQLSKATNGQKNDSAEESSTSGTCSFSKFALLYFWNAQFVIVSKFGALHREHSVSLLVLCMFYS